MRRARKHAGQFDARPVRRLTRALEAEGLDELTARRLATRILANPGPSRLQLCVWLYQETGFKLPLDAADRALQAGGL